MAKLTRHIIDEKLAAASRVGVTLGELTPARIAEVRAELSDWFGDGEHLITFGSMRDKASVQDEMGWSRLSGFLKRRPHVLFYDATGMQDRRASKWPTALASPRFVAECFGFPFYVTDSVRTFIVAMNDHDLLIGVGTAREWIARGF